MTDKPMSEAELLAKLRHGSLSVDASLSLLRQYRDAHRREERERSIRALRNRMPPPSATNGAVRRMTLEQAVEALEALPTTEPENG